MREVAHGAILAKPTLQVDFAERGLVENVDLAAALGAAIRLGTFPLHD